MPLLDPRSSLEVAREHHDEMKGYMPTARFGSPLDLRQEMASDLDRALGAGSEEAIQECLTQHPYMIQYAIPNSGHHGTWAFPKQMVKPRGTDGSPGMIPDFLVATASSLGYKWWVVELKRFDHQFANIKGDALSPEGNRAVVQCSHYLRHMQDYIDAVRSQIRLGELIQPQGSVIIMGDSTTETSAQRRCRGDFDATHPRMEVVSYQRLRKGIAADLRR